MLIFNFLLFSRKFDSMSALIGFIFAILAVGIHGEEHFVKPGEQLKLWPTTDMGRTVSTWTLKAAEGAKIIASCVILSRSCSDHKLTINDGIISTIHCGNERYVLKSSDRGRMTISIETTGFRQGSYCQVRATKPFLNQVYTKRDSSEDGQQEGSKKPSCKCGWTNKPKRRIVGGKDASPNEYPWAVLLGIRRTNFQFCGGSIIAPKYVLTAAHCTYPLQGIPLSVYVGEHDTSKTKSNPNAQKIDVLVAHDHPTYNDKSNVGDISVLELAKSITFNQFVGPVCLPEVQPNLLDEYIKVMGWGHTKTNGEASEILKKVDVKVIDLDICKTVYSQIDTSRPSQICSWAPDRDSCQGDSGGPLVWLEPKSNRLMQVGVVSYGRECASTDPAVNTNVYYYMSFILDIIRGTSSRSDPRICTV